MAKSPVQKTLKVTGIGNALVDILTHADEDFLKAENIDKGLMQLVVLEASSLLYSLIGPAREVSGGSVANSIAILAHLGAPAGFIGKIGPDQFGDIFEHDMVSLGVHFATERANADRGEETGRCISLITPDGERSMSTYLGTNIGFCAEDIDEGLIAASEWIFLEGYQLDAPGGFDAYLKAASAARAAGTKVALTLSDPKCVTRHNAAFQHLVYQYTDALFCNKKELQALFPHAQLKTAREIAGKFTGLLVCTDGSRGATIRTKTGSIHIPVTPVTPVDATGAGDSFAGAFLWALGEGYPLETCGKIAACVAGEIIATSGARPDRCLRTLLADAGLTSGLQTV